jgi:membrane protein required for colicin V production
MTLLDWALVALFVALVVRGWFRGLVREVIGLAVAVVGLFVAFRLSTPLGDVVESLAGTSSDVSRLIAGVVLLVAISVGAAIVANVLHHGLRLVPGLTTLNRVGGAGLSLVAGGLVIALVVSLAALLPMPIAAADQLDRSAVAGAVVDPRGLPQRVIGVIAGDRVIAAVLGLQDLVGEHRLVGPDVGSERFPAASPRELRASGKAANRAFDLLNRERAAADAAPLARSQVLDDMALRIAEELYTTGRLSDRGRDGSTVEDRLAAADIIVEAADQVVVLASSPRSAHEGLIGDAPSRREMVDRNHRRAGVAVVKGPLGLMLVEVLST